MRTEITMTMLEYYREIRYYDLTNASFNCIGAHKTSYRMSVGNCAEYMESKLKCFQLAETRWKSSRPRDVDFLVRFMKRVLLDMPEGRLKEVIKLMYFSKSEKEQGFYICQDELGIGRSTMYRVKRDAERTFENVLFRRASKEKLDLYRVYDEIMEAQRLHMPGGICYEDSLKVLKNYRKVNYTSVKMRSLEKDNLTRWMNSSMMENTYAQLITCGEILRRMRQLGYTAESCAELIDIYYFNEKYIDLSSEERRKVLNITDRVFYERKRCAISLFSKILWGATGYRHPMYGEFTKDALLTADTR